MKCVSCETEINPKWSHAININVCPFCGKHIMEEHLKNLFVSLAETMGALQTYPDQLNDWLLSNHNYIKTDSPQLKMYLPKDVLKEMRKDFDDAEFQEKKKSIVKVKTQDGEEDVLVEKVQSEAKTESFFDRAEAISHTERNKKDGHKSIAAKTQHLKEVTQKIKEERAAGIIDEAGLASMIGSEKADPDTVAELQSMMATGDIIASGLPETSDGDDDDIPSAVLSMASRAAAKKGHGGGPNEADLQSLHEMQHKVKNAQKRLASGKGGFSRS